MRLKVKYQLNVIWKSKYNLKHLYLGISPHPWFRTKKTEIPHDFEIPKRMIEDKMEKPNLERGVTIKKKPIVKSPIRKFKLPMNTASLNSRGECEYSYPIALKRHIKFAKNRVPDK